MIVMKIASLTTITIALFSLFAASEPIQAQQPEHPRNPFTINTDLVITWAQIFDAKDATVVKGLGITDFLLREDGKQQQISLVKEGQPLSVVILVQGGYCDTWGMPEYELRRGREALRQLGEAPEIALMAWIYDVVLTQPLTKDPDVIARQLEDRSSFSRALRLKRLQYSSNGYRYFPRIGDAVYQAAQYLEKKASPGRRKIVIVIAYPDLMNEEHEHTAAEVNELLEKTATTVYGLYQHDGYSPGSGLLSKLGISKEGKRRRSGGALEEFAANTGGSILTGKPEEGDETLIKLAGLIRSSYTIGYYPENTDFDGRFRRISLELSPSGKAKVGKVNIKTRTGYLALRPSATAASEAHPER
jgi:VWFA-related protein